VNTDTSQVYWDERDVRAAELRGEPLLPLIPITTEARYAPSPPLLGTRAERRAQASEYRRAGKRKEKR